MGKVASTVIYITVAMVVLFLISHSPPHDKKDDDHHRRHDNPHRPNRRLKLRSSFEFNNPNRHDPVPFDPLVADIERKREDKLWEMQHVPSAPAHEPQPEWEDFVNAEDYLNDEERFNVTNRLLLLFPRIDVDPADGFVTQHELTEWNVQQAVKEVMHRTQREMEIHDKNKDGFVSFAEYEPPSWVQNSDNGSFGYDMGWWKEEHFNASDADGDGLLNITEFNDFLHPADTKNPNLLLWLCKEEVRERDSDKDGKVNFKEFFHGLFDLVRNYDEEDHNSSHVSHDSMEAPARQLFSQLDKDGDRFLSDVELSPIIGKLHPSEHYYAKQQADYIIAQADSDKDGRLTLTEMIENPYVFYSAIFKDDEEEEDYVYHDEFR
ncbi:EF_hand_3 domain-containing protein/EF_hand_5 domain-containing protein/EF_hand_6 domain-containing protein [Cephalotus follicularis]|uniref:EF_hand_3 domain-containing protein/EF_hand_5 domain-containing protein/EF_hand_6 domain-containing protein n=1 Tax=Cephalotus follicularis TaxID=3775 RepID=A0A1Q3B3E5_CEPFO|nr:EF_hand_3 domain-containing protein/EF_hand_5 domain-containing protein/EF_hand_6 domain-containing protein [Cephalotus follicularis]